MCVCVCVFWLQSTATAIASTISSFPTSTAISSIRLVR